MPLLKVGIKQEILIKVKKAAERLWPGHGKIGVNRLIRDAIRRYLRYWNDKPRDRD